MRGRCNHIHVDKTARFASEHKYPASSHHDWFPDHWVGKQESRDSFYVCGDYCTAIPCRIASFWQGSRIFPQVCSNCRAPRFLLFIGGGPSDDASSESTKHSRMRCRYHPGGKVQSQEHAACLGQRVSKW